VTRLGTIAVFLALAATLACAKPRLESHMYFDDKLDFAKIETFAITPGAGGTPENRKLAEDGIRKGLETKGLRVAPAEQADVLVQIDLGLRSKVRIDGAMSTGQYAGMAVSMRERNVARDGGHDLLRQPGRGGRDPQGRRVAARGLPALLIRDR
jgi:hypothetical protein